MLTFKLYTRREERVAICPEFPLCSGALDGLSGFRPLRVKIQGEMPINKAKVGHLHERTHRSIKSRTVRTLEVRVHDYGDFGIGVPANVVRGHHARRELHH